MGLEHARSAASRHRGRLQGVLVLSAAVLVVEVVGGILTGSLALLADAGHMLTDVAGVGLALLAVWLGARPPSTDRTYGLLRMEVLAAVLNAVLLLGVTAAIVVEAVRRLAGPSDVAGVPMLVVASIGLLANAIGMWLLREGKHESLNVRGAYLEVLGDLLGSLAVLAAAAVVALTGYERADPIASLLVAVLILPRTWRLLREAVDILLQATPRDVELEEVRRHIVETPQVRDVHDLHAWTLTSGVNVVSAHVVVEDGADPARVLDRLCACLQEDFDVEHSTLQLETEDRRRLEQAGHA